MNTHSIPVDVHRKLGLDNNEPSGLEGDRLLAGDKAKEAKAEKMRAFYAVAPENLEDAVCRVRWMTHIAMDCIDNIADTGGLDKAAIVVRAAMEDAERLFDLLYGEAN